MCLTGRPTLRAVLEVPPFVVIEPVQAVRRAVLLQPTRALRGPHVKCHTRDVPRLVRWQRPPPGRLLRTGALNLRGVQRGLGGRIPIAGGQSEQLPVPPQSLSACRLERRPRRRSETGQVL